MANYYLRYRARITGPFSVDDLRTMAERGELSPLHSLSSDRVNWTPSDQVKGLFPSAAANANNNGAINSPTDDELTDEEIGGNVSSTSSKSRPRTNAEYAGQPKFCSACGTHLLAHSDLCPHCGMKAKLSRRKIHLPNQVKNTLTYMNPTQHPGSFFFIIGGMLLAAICVILLVMPTKTASSNASSAPIIAANSPENSAPTSAPKNSEPITDAGFLATVTVTVDAEDMPNDAADYELKINDKIVDTRTSKTATVKFLNILVKVGDVISVRGVRKNADGAVLSTFGKNQNDWPSVKSETTNYFITVLAD